ncbi:hypothetical protein T10_3386 [Trichinella papuae]|uniref:Uncharacterized protein n=1 Tax=Trichinella papuae TaxID=268474 RepID=A0A0V1MY11_9BILA|nr:hypothetical protein T10_3386 [Trichinella papuae]
MIDVYYRLKDAKFERSLSFPVVKSDHCYVATLQKLGRRKSVLFVLTMQLIYLLLLVYQRFNSANVNATNGGVQSVFMAFLAFVEKMRLQIANCTILSASAATKTCFTPVAPFALHIYRMIFVWHKFLHSIMCALFFRTSRSDLLQHFSRKPHLTSDWIPAEILDQQRLANLEAQRGGMGNATAVEL